MYKRQTEHGWKAAWRKWIDAFKSKSEFRRVCLLAFYTALILFRTLLNRNLLLFINFYANIFMSEFFSFKLRAIKIAPTGTLQFIIKSKD